MQSNALPLSYTPSFWLCSGGDGWIQGIRSGRQSAWRTMDGSLLTLYSRQLSKPSPRKGNARRQSSCLRRPYKWLRKEEKWKVKEKGEIHPCECRVPENRRRDKKAFLSEHCKEIEKNKRMEKTSNLFKKTGRYQGNISFKDGHNKGQKWKGPNKSRRD